MAGLAPVSTTTSWASISSAMRSPDIELGLSVIQKAGQVQGAHSGWSVSAGHDPHLAGARIATTSNW